MLWQVRFLSYFTFPKATKEGLISDIVFYLTYVHRCVTTYTSTNRRFFRVINTPKGIYILVYLYTKKYKKGKLMYKNNIVKVKLG